MNTVKDAFLPNLCWIIGNGKSVKNFDDRWIPYLPGFRPSSTARDLTPCIWVPDLLLPGTNTWNEPLLHSFFPAFEVNAILRIIISYSNDDDRLIWVKTKSGLFSSKSFYTTLLAAQASSSGTESSFPWYTFWKVTNCSPRIKIFAWRLLIGAVAIRAAISRFITNISQHCPLCGSAPETIDHLFIHCPIIQTILLASPVGFRVEDSNISISKLFTVWLQSNSTGETFRLGICLLWSLWKARNRALFDNKEFYISIVIKNALKVFNDYSVVSTDIFQSMRVDSAPNLVAPQQLHWLPPAEDVIKIHVDRAIGHSNSSCAAIAHNANCVFEGCGTQCNPLCSPEEAEAMAFLLGLQLALKMNFTTCIIEGDALNVIRCINDTSTPIPWRIRSIILHIRSLLPSFCSVSFVYVNRACNSAAHVLAKFASS
ncbi:Reverse transcriptase zinc-binding domain [Macleaya cordata]|uniref:Reverse transcriptase zinc-binding domain n=1 Tax=Macleaya cordata TaxID=56857 RepID=A0A200Q050_MACCD|nr:Reverse transcriptase zinc-binding domain [Macleaya cordata]